VKLIGFIMNYGLGLKGGHITWYLYSHRFLHPIRNTLCFVLRMENYIHFQRAVLSRHQYFGNSHCRCPETLNHNSILTRLIDLEDVTAFSRCEDFKSCVVEALILCKEPSKYQFSHGSNIFQLFQKLHLNKT
jgi:hypothetical protein